MRHLEESLQESCVRWFDYQYPKLSPLLFCVPNGGKRNAREAARLKRQGVRPGVTDLILLVAKNDFNALCIELKTKTGKVSEKQKEWQEAARKAGCEVIIVRGLAQFVNEVEKYLNL